jgi:hypothetical protein
MYYLPRDHAGGGSEQTQIRAHLRAAAWFDQIMIFNS